MLQALLPFNSLPMEVSVCQKNSFWEWTDPGNEQCERGFQGGCHILIHVDSIFG